MWRFGRTGARRLPEERRALAERYTIDAEEARRREQLAAEARAAAEAAAREAAEVAAEAARLAATRERPGPAAGPAGLAEAALPPASEEPEVAGPERALAAEPEEAAPELPIYRWLDRS